MVGTGWGDRRFHRTDRRKGPVKCWRLVIHLFPASEGAMTVIQSTLLASSEASVRRLENGLRIGLLTLPWAKTVSLGVWLEAGSQNETPGQEGIAHFLEHMPFKGTKRRSGKAIAKAIDSLGGYCDAFTDKEVTCFYCQVLPDQVPEALTLLHELTTQPAIRAKDVETEKQIILSEIQSVKDSPDDLVGELFYEALWDGHPLSRPVLGTEQSVQSMTPRLLLSFHKNFYTPDRMIVVGAGAIEEGSLEERVAEIFGRLRRNGAAGSLFAQPRGAGRIRLERRPTAQLYFCIGVPGLPTSDPRTYTLSLLDAIVGGGASSRLFLSVREKRGLAYSISSGATFFKEGGHFWISGSCDAKKAEKVMKVIANELKRLCREGLRAGELEAARTQLKLSAITVQESVLGSMMRLGRQIYYFARPIPLSGILNRIDEVQDEDVLQMAHHLFLNSTFSAAFVGPVNESQADRLMAILNEG
ncbi:MAG: insulinase family protein [Armatimonadetes bacterium]|nr:insulinase family protein [Armatimonadota bacterium]MDW8120789.1 pitrilysin family protein [Armatimonadota bacterium]